MRFCAKCSVVYKIVASRDGSGAAGRNSFATRQVAPSSLLSNTLMSTVRPSPQYEDGRGVHFSTTRSDLGAHSSATCPGTHRKTPLFREIPVLDKTGGNAKLSPL